MPWQLNFPLFLCAILWMTVSGSLACSVPVFRYALELWESDPYIVYLMHDGTQAEQINEAEAFLEPYAERNALDTIRANMADPRVAEAIKRRGIPPVGSLPRVVATLPRSYLSKPAVLMDEPLTKGNLRRLVDSPVRRELARRLIDGESAVWLLMESGDPTRDDAVEERLRAHLDRLEAEIKLPELEPKDMRTFELDSDSLKIKFSVLRFSRVDPIEALLVNTLLHSEPDLPLEEPVVFPVFGRGRKLAGFSGERITEENIVQATLFITGSCSCEVKESNPGMDLLVPVDWDKYIDNLIGFDESLPPLTGYEQFIPPNKAACPAGTGEKVHPVDEKPNLLRRNVLLAIGMLATVLGLSSAIVLKKRYGGGE